jgi:multidrug efflux pump subunit AcrA (membrane-fusion protein)
MTVDVSIEVRRTPSQFALPASAVSTAEGAPFVLRVDDGRLVRTPVAILGRNPEWVAVTGIEPGTKVLRNIRQGKAEQKVRS